MHYWLSIGIFIVTYIMIMHEKLHRSTVAISAAVLVVLMGIVNQEKAIESIDFNTILLLMGMMILVGISHRSGMFEYAAIRVAKLAGGNPIRMLVAFGIATAVASALLDNVTTVLLMVPVTVAITDRLEINPIPFYYMIILSSNIGGTATLIGDPPNIMIGSATGLGFMDFVMNLTLPATIILVVTIGVIAAFYRSSLIASEEKIAAVMDMEEKDYIKDYALMKKSLAVLGVTVLAFCFHQFLHLESATVAMAAAAALLIISGESIEEALLTIEWPTILFFAGLFILVGGLEATGVLNSIAGWALGITGGDEVRTGVIVLWMSALASAFVDNIPFVATMIPLLQNMGSMSGMGLDSVWWALALGACLGGNGTLIGASANVIVAGMAERMGTPIRFVHYLKVGFPLMIMSIVLAHIYLYIRFWMG